MLKLISILMALASVSIAVSDSEWTVYKAVYNKLYGEREDFLRRMIYQDNLQTIKTHNEKYARGQFSYFMGENQFTDMTHSEFVSTMNGLRINKPVETFNAPVNTSLPQSVDWVKKGYVTPVKNQGQCGSCWAFSTTGSLEGQHFKATGKLVSLSESNLVDCSSSYGNLGCRGGLMDRAFEYIRHNGGIDTEASYPYRPSERRCQFSPANVGATVKDFKDIPSGSENDLQEAIANVGPVSVAIDASHESFQHYRGGVYDEMRCSSSKLDHGVLAVGYGVDNGQDYWLVKNSWGTMWGMNGYIRMSRNKNNQCGIASQGSYPIV